MSDAAELDPGYTVASYFALVEKGYLEADDHVELLEGLIVASPPQSPLHASSIARVQIALAKAVGDGFWLRVQMPLVAGPRSVPEPDIAMVVGGPDDYDDKHPDSALLVVEVSDSSLPHDRLSKSRIYARAGVREYWIVNLRDRSVEIRSKPNSRTRVYASVRTAIRGESIELDALPGVVVRVADLLKSY